MRKEQVKTGVLSVVLLGAILQATSCAANFREKQKDDDTDSIELSEKNDALLKPVEIQVDGEVLGVVEFNPEIYSIIDEKGYSLSNNPHISSDVLDNYQYTAFENSKGVTNTDVNLRTGPGTDYDIIRALYPDSSVDLIARCDNGWYMVSYNGALGFVRGDFVKQISDKQLTEELQNLPETISLVQATDNVKVRPEPNTSQPEYGVLAIGKSLEIVRRMDNGWYEVIYEGKTGYVCGDYVKEAYALVGDFERVAYANKDVTIYDVPYGDAIATAPCYESFKIYKELDGYYYVECDGKIGFISKEDCNVLTGTFVVVDISNQILTLYRGNQVLLVSDVVTGKDSSPSDIGIFDIDAKATDAWLTGADYSTHVNFWMPYNGGEGLHDAVWRAVFGGTIYHESGSHGCVNCPYETAEQLYNYLSVGDKVLVKG